jgi:hypothetical protein
MSRDSDFLQNEVTHPASGAGLSLRGGVCLRLKGFGLRKWSPDISAPYNVTFSLIRFEIVTYACFMEEGAKII